MGDPKPPPGPRLPPADSEFFARESETLAQKYATLAERYRSELKALSGELAEVKGAAIRAETMATSALERSAAAERVARRIEVQFVRVEEKIDRALERSGTSSTPPRSPVPSMVGRQLAQRFPSSDTGNFRRVPVDALEGIGEKFKELEEEIESVKRERDMERAGKLAVEGALAARNKADSDLRSKLAWIGGIVAAVATFVGWLISHLLQFVH